MAEFHLLRSCLIPLEPMVPHQKSLYPNDWYHGRIISYSTFKMKNKGPVMIDELKVLTMKLYGSPGDM